MPSTDKCILKYLHLVFEISFESILYCTGYTSEVFVLSYHVRLLLIFSFISHQTMNMTHIHCLVAVCQPLIKLLLTYLHTYIGSVAPCVCKHLTIAVLGLLQARCHSREPTSSVTPLKANDYIHLLCN